MNGLVEMVISAQHPSLPRPKCCTKHLIIQPLCKALLHNLLPVAQISIAQWIVQNSAVKCIAHLYNVQRICNLLYRSIFLFLCCILHFALAHCMLCWYCNFIYIASYYIWQLQYCLALLLAIICRLCKILLQFVCYWHNQKNKKLHSFISRIKTFFQGMVPFNFGDRRHASKWKGRDVRTEGCAWGSAQELCLGLLMRLCASTLPCLPACLPGCLRLLRRRLDHWPLARPLYRH